jgi:hypothetical protein
MVQNQMIMPCVAFGRHVLANDTFVLILVFGQCCFYGLVLAFLTTLMLLLL